MTTQTAEPKRCCAHDSDCAVHNMPAYPAGPCNCSLNVEQVAMKLLPPFPSETDRREAAAMLRSQASEIERLRKALIMCHTSLCYAAGCIENMTTQEEIKIEIGIDAARAALKKQA